MRRRIAVLLVTAMLLTTGCGSRKQPESAAPVESSNGAGGVSSGAPSKPPEVLGNPGFELEPDEADQELSDGDKRCFEVFGEAYPGLEAKAGKLMAGDGPRIRMTSMYRSYVKEDAVDVPTLDWSASKKQMASKYTYSYDRIDASEVFAERASDRDVFGFEVRENAKVDGRWFNLRSEVDVYLTQDIWDTEEWKKIVCMYVNSNLNNPKRDKGEDETARGMITEGWGGAWVGRYVPEEDPTTTRMACSTNLTKYTSGRSGVNIVVVTQGSVQHFEEDEEAEGALKKRLEEMEDAIWETFGLSAEAEAVRLAPVLGVS